MFKRFKPAREENFEIIADIDKVVSSPIGIKLHGRDHRIEPLTTETFLKWSKSVGELYSLASKEVTEDQMKQAYFNCIHSLCKTVTMDDIMKCEKSQIAALFGVILDHCTGRAHTDEYKKKVKTIETQENNLKNSGSPLPN